MFPLERPFFLGGGDGSVEGAVVRACVCLVLDGEDGFENMSVRILPTFCSVPKTNQP